MFIFQIILIVVFVSSACSATKLRGFSTGSQVFNLIVITLGFQWALLSRGFFYLIYQDLEIIRIDVHDLTEAFSAAFSLSISNSFLLGRTSSNTLFIIVIHPPLYTVAKLVSEEILLITDPGSALSVHLFGAIFGCCAHKFLSQNHRSSSSYALGKNDDCREHGNNTPVLISSAILFVSLPMLNGISESDAEMTRAIINTILAGASSLVTSVTIMVGMTLWRP